MCIDDAVGPRQRTLLEAADPGRIYEFRLDRALEMLRNYNVAYHLPHSVSFCRYHRTRVPFRHTSGNIHASIRKRKPNTKALFLFLSFANKMIAKKTSLRGPIANYNMGTVRYYKQWTCSLQSTGLVLVF